MKKKSFLSGFSAKIALVAVALSSALLTGCYKDEGLDTDTPAGTVDLPKATYTLTGTIVDKDGVMIADAKGTVDGATFNGATFSFQYTDVEGSKEVTIVASAPGYEEAKKTVKILEVKPGQSAVYSEIIVLTKEEVDPVYKTYDLDVAVFGADDTNIQLTADKDYSLKVTDETGKDVSPLTGLAAGHYNVVVTPTDADKYIATTCSVDLPKVEGEANAAYYLPVVLNLKDAEKEYQILYAEVNLGEKYQLTSMQIFKNNEVVATSTSTKLFYVAEMDGSIYKLKVVYTDGTNDYTREFNYSEGQTSFVMDLTGASTSVGVEDGKVPANDGIPLGGEDFMTIQEGTIATLNGENYNGIFDVVRLEAAEGVDVLREYVGTPDGLKFSKALQITFRDAWDGQLGELKLEYLTKDGWTDADGGSVEKNGEYYVMNVMHFSNFRAQLPIEFDDNDVTSSKIENTTDIDKKNDNDASVVVTYKYTRQEGMIVDDVEAAVVAAGFTGTAAVAYVKNLITEKLAEAGYANVGMETVAGGERITVTPWTVLNKVTKTQVINNINCVFKIAGKTVTVGVTKAGETTITPDMFVYGHGHGHAHGHGGDLNAGGGIIEGE